MNIGLYFDTKEVNWRPYYSFAWRDRGKIRFSGEWLWFCVGINTF